MSGKKFIYGITLFFITLTGFAQMPIFKRYYIADIPGLGWLAKFYVTHYMHYVFAAVLVGFCVYLTIDFFLNRQSFSRITRPGYLKIFSILGLILTGGFMVVKNMSEIYYPHFVIIMLDIVHLLLCMTLLLASAYTLVRKKADLP